MKKLKQILFVTEDHGGETVKWFLSWLRPDFQGGESAEISEDEARVILKAINK